MREKPLEGELNISRVSGSDNLRPIRIRLRDKASGREIVEAEMSLADFALALTGFYGPPCLFRLADRVNLDRVGKVMETKHQAVLIPNDLPGEKAYRGPRWREAVRSQIAQHETDGWIGNDDDAGNNWAKRGDHPPDAKWTMILFRRWVDPETGEPVPGRRDDEEGGSDGDAEG